MSIRFPLCLLAAAALLPVAGAAEPVTVKTALLREIAVYPERNAPATVVSLNETTISAEIAAPVITFPARVGDRVEAGAVLLSLDCSDYRLAARRAEATVESLQARVALARKQLDRAKSLEQQAVAVEAVDTRGSELAVLESEQRIAQANRELASRNVARCEIKSPFPGLVTARLSAVGQFAGVGSPLVRVLDLSQIEVSAQVPDGEVAQIESAGELSFSYGARRYSLRLRAVLSAINPSTRNQEVRLSFSGEPAIVGAAGKLLWTDPRPHIPSGLLVSRDGNPGIFVVKNGNASFVPLPEAQPGRTAPVDLPADTAIITDGHYGLQHDTGVTVGR